MKNKLGIPVLLNIKKNNINNCIDIYNSTLGFTTYIRFNPTVYGIVLYKNTYNVHKK